MKDVIDVLELQGQREREKLRTLVDYAQYEGSFVGVRFIMECGMCFYKTVQKSIAKIFKLNHYRYETKHETHHDCYSCPCFPCIFRRS